MTWDELNELAKKRYFTPEEYLKDRRLIDTSHPAWNTYGRGKYIKYMAKDMIFDRKDVNRWLRGN